MLDQETQPRKRQRTEQGVPAELGQPGADGAATASPEDSVGCPDPSMPGCMKVPVGVSSHVPPGLASMGMPCNGCSCGASLGSHPGMLGIMHQQQQYMMHQMGMFNHMMMMGAMMSPMMGQMISPTPTDGTLLATTSPSSLPDPALVASKLDEDDDVPPGPSSNINHPNYRPPDVEPIPGVTDRRWEGRIKMWFEDKGYGFISNEELKKRFKDLDVFLHQNQKRENRSGSKRSSVFHCSTRFLSNKRTWSPSACTRTTGASHRPRSCGARKAASHEAVNAKRREAGPGILRAVPWKVAHGKGVILAPSEICYTDIGRNMMPLAQRNQLLTPCDDAPERLFFFASALSREAAKEGEFVPRVNVNISDHFMVVRNTPIARQMMEEWFQLPTRQSRGLERTAIYYLPPSHAAALQSKPLKEPHKEGAQQTPFPNVEAAEDPTGTADIREELEDARPETPQWPFAEEVQHEDAEDAQMPAMTEPWPVAGPWPTEVQQFDYEQRLQLQMIQQMRMQSFQQYQPHEPTQLPPQPHQLPQSCLPQSFDSSSRAYHVNSGRDSSKYFETGDFGPSDANPGCGGSINFALKADVLAGRRSHGSDDVADAIRQCSLETGDFGPSDANLGCGGSINFALKAAGEALNRAMESKPRADPQEFDRSLATALGLAVNPAGRRKAQKPREEHPPSAPDRSSRVPSITRKAAEECLVSAGPCGFNPAEQLAEQAAQTRRLQDRADLLAERRSGTIDDVAEATGPRSFETGDFGPSSADLGSGGSINFALQAAGEALNRAMESKPRTEPQEKPPEEFYENYSAEEYPEQMYPEEAPLQAGAGADNHVYERSRALALDLDLDLVAEEAESEEIEECAEDAVGLGGLADALGLEVNPAGRSKAPLPREGYAPTAPSRSRAASLTRKATDGSDSRSPAFDYEQMANEAAAARARRPEVPPIERRTLQKRDNLVDFILADADPARATTPRFIRGPSMKRQAMSTCYSQFPSRKQLTPRRHGSKQVQPAVATLPPLSKKKRQQLWQ
eukprot:s531_g20.t2